MKIKVNIPGFGERYCSDNVEYKLSSDGDYYRFYKKGTNIYHNEYGPAVEWKYKSYSYLINDKHHRLSGIEVEYWDYKEYNVIGKYLGKTKEEFIQNLANVLIPKNKNWL